jgi:hypothetical protein
MLGGLVLIGAVLAIVLLLLRGLALILLRRGGAAGPLIAAAVVSGAYTMALLMFSLTSHDRTIDLGQPKCFDDWCVTVMRAEHDDTSAIVEVEVKSQAARAQMRPDRPQVEVVDMRGRVFTPVSTSDPPLNKELAPGEEFVKSFNFKVARNLQHPVVLVSEGGWLTRLIIGDENSYLHRKVVTPLQ